jgi:hypothetical protein
LTTSYLVDHRHAQSQLRYRLLCHLNFLETTLEEVSLKSGLSLQHLTGFLMGKVGLPYRDMARLVSAAFEEAELRVTMDWVECGQGFSKEEPYADDEGSEKLLVEAQRRGKVPTTVWPEKAAQK